MTSGRTESTEGTDTADVAVVGGGLAGITAALRLARTGARVTLLESRAQLGGATYSFARKGMTVDTGQHVFLRCYHAYRWLLAELGTTAHAGLQDRFSVCVRSPERSRPSWLRRTPGLPAPFHLLPGLLGYAVLGPGDRLHAARAAAALRQVDPTDPASDEQDFGSWLAAHGQSDAAVRRLWAPFAVAALNLAPEQASLALAAMTLRTALLDSPTGGDIGIPRVPLAALHAEPAAAELRRQGVRLRTRTRVEQIRPGAGGPGGSGEYHLTSTEGELRAHAVVVAVPHPVASRIVPDEAAPQRAEWARLGSSPIVDLHLVYDQPVTESATEGGFFAAVDSPVQWVFDRTHAARLSSGQYLVLSLSAADALAALPSREIVQRLLPAVGDLLPRARATQLRDVFVTREPRATFRQAPGTGRLRPPAQTALPGLVLAGAWTATGWPDTMEGAVRSGLQAADVLATQLDADQLEVVP